MVNIRLHKGQTDPRNPHATSVSGPARLNSVNINSVVIESNRKTIYREPTINIEDYKQRHKDWFSSLDVKQQEAVYLYTNHGYKDFNNALLNGTQDDNLISQIYHLNRAVDNVLEPTTVYRAVKTFDLDSMTIGESVSFDNFSSTTLDPHTAFKFMDKNNPIIFEIIATRGAEVSSDLKEYEILLPYDSEYVVENVLTGHSWNAGYKDSDGYSVGVKNATIIQLTQVK